MKIKHLVVGLLLIGMVGGLYAASTDYKVLNDGTVFGYTFASKVNPADVRAYMDGTAGRPTYATWYANQATTDTLAVYNAALASGAKTVIAPDGHYKITGTIVKPDGVNLFGTGRRATFIEPSAQTFPVITVSGDNAQFEMGNFTINYGVATGNARATNPLAKGISILTSGGAWPSQFSIRNVSIFYAYNGLYCDDYAFMYELSNIYISECGHYGVYFPLAHVGTTATMNNVWINGGAGGFYISNLIGLVMNNCGTDNVAGLSPVNIFTGCKSILNYFNLEGCTVGNGALLDISGGVSTINGYKGSSNIYNETVGNESYGIRTDSGGRSVIINADNYGETHTGAGSAYAIIGSSDSSHVLILGHGVIPPTGGISSGIYTANNKVTIFDSQILSLYNDLDINQMGKGVVLTNAAGTVTKRVRLNDAGNGLIYETP